MLAAKLYGPKNMRTEDIPEPKAPGRGQAVIKVKTVGVCGSDLHMYEDAKIGYITIDSPTILGHEFGGVIETLGQEALDGEGHPLQIGQRVAVDPAVPCWRCEMCEQGHPNLCPNHHFYGVYPTEGALQEKMLVDARSCFPLPDSITDAEVPLLETLGIALHSVDLSRIKVAKSVVVLGCGPVGILIVKVAKLAGAGPIYAVDKFPWRTAKAKAFGATEVFTTDQDPIQKIMDITKGRGADIVFEAAWADHSVQQSIDVARPGATVVMVGIPGNDKFEMKQSVARRKGLTIMMARRMKHTYPRAIYLATQGGVDLKSLVSHHFPLSQTSEAFAFNMKYQEGLQKIIIDV
jgi:L-iditol 2-dehydrogenase